MNFCSALHYLKAGYQLRRSNWAPDFFTEKTIINGNDCVLMSNLTILTLEDMMADDWELIKNE